MYLCVRGIDLASFYFFLIVFRTVPTVFYFRTVPTVFYFRTVPTVFYFRTVPTVCYFRTVPTVFYFVFHFITYSYIEQETLQPRHLMSLISNIV